MPTQDSFEHTSSPPCPPPMIRGKFCVFLQATNAAAEDNDKEICYALVRLQSCEGSQLGAGSLPIG
jgi:hypothetical protein